MRKFTALLLTVVLSGLVFLYSCNNEEDPKPAPTISIQPLTVEGTEGSVVQVSISWTAASEISTISSSSANATTPGSATGTSGTFTSSVTVVGPNEQIIYTVTDMKNRTAAATVSVAVTDTPPPDIVTIKDADLMGNTTYNWSSDVIYLCDGLVYLEADGVLNIEAGTVIKFKESPTTGEPTSALIITRGAAINATGTSDNPIIFTAESDDLTTGLPPDQNTKWAGLVILGNAPVEKDGQKQLQIEGISTSEPRGRYGGEIPEDNSGILEFISIRYTGFALNGQSGDEIQGLTLGGVGNGTTIDYVEVFSSSDDGVEIFGGTVDIKHFAVAFASDDSFDFDQGWTGQGQFIFALQGDGLVSDYDYAGEWDGFAVPTDIFSAPNMVNCTLVGPGKDVANPLRDRAILMREGFAGKLVNSIVADFPGFGIQITSDETDNSSCYRINNPVTDSRSTFQLELLNNTWSAIKNYDGADIATIIKGDCTDDIKTEMTGNNNTAVVANVLTSTLGRGSGSAIDPRPSVDVSGTYDVSGWGLENVDYRGAFAPGQDIWLKGWSTLSKYGYLVQ